MAGSKLQAVEGPGVVGGASGVCLPALPLRSVPPPQVRCTASMRPWRAAGVWSTPCSWLPCPPCPAGLSCLVRLQHLDLSHNDLSALPQWMTQLKVSGGGEAAGRAKVALQQVPFARGGAPCFQPSRTCLSLGISLVTPSKTWLLPLFAAASFAVAAPQLLRTLPARAVRAAGADRPAHEPQPHQLVVRWGHGAWTAGVTALVSSTGDPCMGCCGASPA